MVLLVIFPQSQNIPLPMLAGVRNFRLVALLMGFAVLAATGVAGIVNAEKAGLQPAAAGVIEPGDNLEISVMEDASFSGLYPVRRGGYLILPQIGRVPVAGKTIPQAEEAISKALEATRLPQATVKVERFEQLGKVEIPPVSEKDTIYVTGRVMKPGSHRLPEGKKFTVGDAIRQSGGFRPFADKKKVHVLRSMPDGTKARLPINLIDVETGKRADVELQPGDIVVVPENFYSW